MLYYVTDSGECALLLLVSHLGGLLLDTIEEIKDILDLKKKKLNILINKKKSFN